MLAFDVNGVICPSRSKYDPFLSLYLIKFVGFLQKLAFRGRGRRMLLYSNVRSTSDFLKFIVGSYKLLTVSFLKPHVFMINNEKN